MKAIDEIMELLSLLKLMMGHQKMMNYELNCYQWLDGMHSSVIDCNNLSL